MIFIDFFDCILCKLIENSNNDIYYLYWNSNILI